MEEIAKPLHGIGVLEICDGQYVYALCETLVEYKHRDECQILWLKRRKNGHWKVATEYAQQIGYEDSEFLVFTETTINFCIAYDL